MLTGLLVSPKSGEQLATGGVRVIRVERGPGAGDATLALPRSSAIRRRARRWSCRRDSSGKDGEIGFSSFTLSPPSIRHLTLTRLKSSHWRNAAVRMHLWSSTPTSITLVSTETFREVARDNVTAVGRS
jgi:hypothetical protein